MAKDSMSVGVVVERRRIDNPWQDYSWRPVAVIPGAPPVEEWRILDQGETGGKEWTHFLAGNLDLDLHSGETEGYRVNLSNRPPVVYVVLSTEDEDREEEVSPFMVTVCPYEAEGYLENGDNIVESVAMPEEILAWVGRFIDQYHVDVPFQKRKQKKAYDPRKSGFQRHRQGGGHE